MTHFSYPPLSLRDRMLNFDPGLASLRTAIRGTLTVGLSLLIIYLLSRSLDFSLMLGMPGIGISLMAAIAIADPSPAEQKRTLLLLPFVCAIPFSFGTWIRPFRFGVVTLLLILTYLAVTLRRFGPRGRALGTLMFMSYFNSIFLPIPTAQLWIAVGCLFAAFGVGYLARFHLFPERPDRVIAAYLDALVIRSRLGLCALRLSFDAQNAREAVLAAMTREIPRINDLALEIDQLLLTYGSSLSKPRPGELQIRVFEIEMEIRDLYAGVWRTVQRGPLSEGQRDAYARKTDSMIQELTALPSQIQTEGDRPLDIGQKSAPTPEGTQALRRIALQGAIAMAIAVGLGSWLSPTRWYWAALTAFFVLANASRADTILRAVLRVIGTAAGLSFGIAMAHELAAFREAELVMLFVCVFLGLYSFRWAYGFWSAACFSGLIALLFDVMGMMTGAHAAEIRGNRDRSSEGSGWRRLYPAQLHAWNRARGFGPVAPIDVGGAREIVPPASYRERSGIDPICADTRPGPLAAPESRPALYRPNHSP